MMLGRDHQRVDERKVMEKGNELARDCECKNYMFF